MPIRWLVARGTNQGGNDGGWDELALHRRRSSRVHPIAQIVVISTAFFCFALYGFDAIVGGRDGVEGGRHGRVRPCSDGSEMPGADFTFPSRRPPYYSHFAQHYLVLMNHYLPFDNDLVPLPHSRHANGHKVFRDPKQLCHFESPSRLALNRNMYLIGSHTRRSIREARR
jgi:hypothetical protein